jgi:hypothetical protein
VVKGHRSDELLQVIGFGLIGEAWAWCAALHVSCALRPVVLEIELAQVGGVMA